jgi:purine-binding chemotaxis protein CheW
VPVLDLRARFRLPGRPVEPTDHFIVAWAGQRQVALRVDRALELVRVDPADSASAEAVLPGVEYVAQMVRCPAGLILIHDLNTFLTRAEAEALAAALPGSPQDGGKS